MRSTAKASSTCAQVHESQQPDAEKLVSYGIKVRDFAYESTLPPVKPMYLLPHQIQPGLRPFKHIRANDVEDVFSQPTARNPVEGEGNSSKKSKLECMVTEPVLRLGILLTHKRGFVNLDDYDPASDSQVIINSQQSDSAASQVPALYFESQESESYIDTPFVMPHGLLQWPVADNSSIPPSQLDMTLQEAILEPLTYSQLGFFQADEPSQQ